MLLGGNGIEEQFTPLPRIFRDAFIMETWEGPPNVLYAQAFDDMLRFELDSKEFVSRIAGEPAPDLVRRLEGDLSSGPGADIPKQFAATGRALVGAFARHAAGKAQVHT